MSSHTSLSDLCNYSGFIINISKQLAVETKNLAAPQKLPSRISAPVWVRVIRISVRIIRQDAAYCYRCNVVCVLYTTVSLTKRLSQWRYVIGMWTLGPQKPWIKWRPGSPYGNGHSGGHTLAYQNSPAVILNLIRKGQQRCGLWLPTQYCTNLLRLGLEPGFKVRVTVRIRQCCCQDRFKHLRPKTAILAGRS